MRKDAMTSPSRSLIIASTVAFVATLLMLSSTSRAQGSGGNTDPALTAAAQKAFKAIADGDTEALKPIVEPKYAKKLIPEALRPSQTGPKLNAAYDGNVRVMRSESSSAVVQADVFAP